jgi:hypothetical protein
MCYNHEESANERRKSRAQVLGNFYRCLPIQDLGDPSPLIIESSIHCSSQVLNPQSTRMKAKVAPPDEAEKVGD